MTAPKSVWDRTVKGGAQRRWLAAVGAVLAVAVALPLVISAIWATNVATDSAHWQLKVGRQLERELGFRHGTPYVSEGTSFTEVLSIESVVEGGVFDRAGFHDGDILRRLTVNELFRRLHSGRGERLTFRVVDGGNGRALNQRAERAITFAMPSAR